MPSSRANSRRSDTTTPSSSTFTRNNTRNNGGSSIGSNIGGSSSSSSSSSSSNNSNDKRQPVVVSPRRRVDSLQGVGVTLRSSSSSHEAAAAVAAAGTPLGQLAVPIGILGPSTRGGSRSPSPKRGSPRARSHSGSGGSADPSSGKRWSWWSRGGKKATNRSTATSADALQKRNSSRVRPALRIQKKLSFDSGVPSLRMPKSRFGKQRLASDGPVGSSGQSSNAAHSQRGYWRWKYLLYMPLVLLPLCLKIALHLVALRAETEAQRSEQPSASASSNAPEGLSEGASLLRAAGAPSPIKLSHAGQAKPPSSRSASGDATRSALQQQRDKAVMEAVAKGPYDGRLNVLFVMSDQHRHDAIGHYFKDHSPETADLTPNFNRLAAEGAMVTNAFSYIPLCVPSRAALLTGSPPEITNVWRGTDEDVDPRVPTAAAVLQENGYWTEFYGKWHNWEEGLDRDYNFSLAHRHPEDLVGPWASTLEEPKKGKHLKPTALHSRTYAEFLEKHFVYQAPQSGEMDHFHRFPTKRDKRANDFPYTEVLDFGVSVGVDGFGEHKRVKNGSILDFGNPGGKGVNGFVALPPWATESRLIANQTIAALRRIKRENRLPFAVTASFNKPHPPYIVSKYYLDQVWPLLHQLPVSRNVEADFEANRYPHTSKFGNKYPYYRSIANFFKNDPQRRRHLFALYLAGVMELDDNIGLILDALDELDLTHSTLIVYTSDHGDMLGDHGMLGKQVLYEESVRVPLLFRLPGTIAPGKVISQPTSTLDVAPSILDFALNTGPASGRSAHKTAIMEEIMAGKSLRSYLVAGEQGSPGKFDRHAFRGHEESNTDVSIAVEINAEHYMVHSAAWKMIFDVNRNESTVLFDLRRDAHENVNLLAAHQAQARLQYFEVTESLYGYLASWRRYVNGKYNVAASRLAWADQRH